METIYGVHYPNKKWTHCGSTFNWFTVDQLTHASSLTTDNTTHRQCTAVTNTSTPASHADGLEWSSEHYAVLHRIANQSVFIPFARVV